MLLDCVYGLLLSPDTDEPLDSVLAMSFYSGTGIYETSIIDVTKRHATARTRAQWRAHLLFELDESASAAAGAAVGSNSAAAAAFSVGRTIVKAKRGKK